MVAISTRPVWYDDDDDDPIAELVAAVPAWHRDAACQEHPELDWFPSEANRAKWCGLSAACVWCVSSASGSLSRLTSDTASGAEP